MININIKFNKVILNNFFSVGHAEIELNDLGYTIVTGINNKTTDNSQSNGAGKSTIFNAICYALTGETTQGLKNNIENIYNDPNDCWVELNFDVDKDNFIIKRIKTPKSNLKITINGDDVSGKGITESTKLLNDYLPDLTSELVGSVIILGQGMPYRFADNNPSGRKALLEKLTNSDYLVQSVKEKLDSRNYYLSSTLREHEDKLVANDTQHAVYTQQLENLNKSLTESNDYNSEYSLDDRLVYLDNKLKGIDSNIITTKAKLEESNAEVLKITESKTKLVTDSAKNRPLITESIDIRLKDLNENIIECKANKTILEKEIKKLNSYTGICPTCGQPLPDAKKVDTTKQVNELNKLKALYSTLELEINSLTDNKNKLLKDFDDKLNLDVMNFDSSINSYKQSCLTLSVDLDNLTKKHDKTVAEQAKVQGMKDNYDKTVKDIEVTTKLLDELEKDSAELKEKINEDNDRLKIVQKLITLTKKEFRSVLLENVINYMNIKAKEYSEKVFGNSLLSLTANENNIDIIFDRKYYESLSGGEKQKVDIIIQLTLRDLLSYYNGFHTNILVLDEIFDNLDQVGCQNILDLISNLNDIESIFIISHHADELQISHDVEIKVEKSDSGISQVSIQ